MHEVLHMILISRDGTETICTRKVYFCVIDSYNVSCATFEFTRFIRNLHLLLMRKNANTFQMSLLYPELNGRKYGASDVQINVKRYKV